MTEGEVSGWWINTTSTPGQRQLRFVQTPDGIYTVRFYLQTPPSRLFGSDTTGCNRLGDRWLKCRLAADILSERGFEQAAKWEMESQKAWARYLGADLHENYYVNFPIPDFI